MNKAEIIKKLEELETIFGGFAGYYGLRNWKRVHEEGKRKSNIDQTKYEAYGYCADEIKKLLKEIKEGEQ